jgi:hypothetical protein
MRAKGLIFWLKNLYNENIMVIGFIKSKRIEMKAA